MSEAAPAQYKQKSRKGKKAWRKNVDVTEVSAGLDEVRDQIIAGYVALPQTRTHKSDTRTVV
jgi:nucleolar protein 53